MLDEHWLQSSWLLQPTQLSRPACLLLQRAQLWGQQSILSCPLSIKDHPPPPTCVMESSLFLLWNQAQSWVSHSHRLSFSPPPAALEFVQVSPVSNGKGEREKCKETTDPTFPPYSACLFRFSVTVPSGSSSSKHMIFFSRPAPLSYPTPVLWWSFVYAMITHTQQLPTGASFHLISFKSPDVNSLVSTRVSHKEDLSQGITFRPSPRGSRTLGMVSRPHPTQVIYARNFQNMLHITLSKNHIQIITTLILTLATKLNLSPFPSSPQALCPASTKYHKGPGESKQLFALYLCTPACLSSGYVCKVTGWGPEAFGPV